MMIVTNIVLARNWCQFQLEAVLCMIAIQIAAKLRPKGIVKDFNGPGRKYTIENSDSGRHLTRIRRDIRPDRSYVT